MRRRPAAALTGAVLLGALVAAAPRATAAAPVATLDIAIPGPFSGCDPSSPSTSASTAAILSLVLPSSFTMGPLAVPVGDTSVVAQAEVVNLSPQTVVYTIAPNVAWPGGRPFAANDFVRTWLQRRDDRVVADLGYRDIAYVHPNAAGSAVTVGFSAPYADWESLFDLVVPPATHHASCAVPTAALDPSIGPYAIATSSSTQVTLVANPAWSGAPRAYARVVVSANASSAPPPGHVPSAVYLPSPTLAELEAITSTGTFTSRLEHSTTVVSLDFAVRGRSALPPAVRGAVAQLIDRVSILDQLATPIDYTVSPEVSHLFGQGEPGYLGQPGVPVSAAVAPTLPIPGSTGADAYGAGADVEAGDAALVAAGYAKSKAGWLTPAHQRFVTCLAVPADPALRPVASLVAAQLTTQGIAVAWRSAPSVLDVAASLRNGTCTTGIVSRTGDGYVTHSGASWVPPTAPVPHDVTWTGVDDPIVTANADAASAMLNPIEAQPSWNAMDARLWDLMAGLPLFSPSIYEAWSPSIAGLLPCDSLAGFVGQIPTLLPTAATP